ncbi:MAG: tyrosine-protein kinase [Actinomycetota bacterium]|jgi:receptor protein-tyrosine kinase|nr:tyrosine-protein kinase [Actinomycetota bacterium]
MNATVLVRRLVRAWPIYVLTGLLGLLAAAGGNALATPTYRAQVELYASSTSSTNDLSNLYQGGLYAQQQVTTYAQIIDSPTILNPVIAATGSRLTVDALEQRVEVAVRPDTALISVAVSALRPGEAQRLANAVADASSRVIPTLGAPKGSSPPTVAVTVLQRAQRPTAPATPRRTLNLALGLACGLLLGLLAVLVRALLDPLIRSSEQLGRSIGAPPLGEMPGPGWVPRRRRLSSSPGTGGTREAAERLHTSIAMTDPSALRRTLVVTSPVADAGQGLVAVELAMAIARGRDALVVLVDADLRNPDVDVQVNCFPDAGLADVLAGRVMLDDALCPVGRLGLSLLSAGSPQADASELVASRVMLDVISRLEKLYEYVVIKAPPVLPVSDAAVLSALTDGTVVVAERGVTRRRDAAEALRSLYAVRSKVLGGVLTYGVNTPRPGAHRGASVPVPPVSRGAP